MVKVLILKISLALDISVSLTNRYETFFSLRHLHMIIYVVQAIAAQASSNWVPGSPGLPVELGGLPQR